MKRWLHFYACVALLCASRSQAVPSAATSKIPTHVLLVGRAGELADTSAGAFSVVVHDVANVPVAASTVEFRILNCPGARLGSQSYDPASTIRCGTHGVQQVTNLYGEVRMTAVGGGTPGAPPGAGPCAQVFAGGVPLGTVTLAYLDLDGSGGLGSNDISIWLTDFGSGEVRGESDFDGDNQLTVLDLSLWLTVWSAAGSTESPASFCP